jgi:hypothetical protein
LRYGTYQEKNENRIARMLWWANKKTYTVLLVIEIGKKKIKEKSLEATRLAEIKQRIERVLMYRLLRTEKVGIK